jgi:hypothetical protein
MVKATSHYEGALLEEIIQRLKLIQEALEALKTMPADIKRLKKRHEQV